MIRRISGWAGVLCGFGIGTFVFVPQVFTAPEFAEPQQQASEHDVRGPWHHAAHGGALVGLEYGDKEVAHLELQLDPDSGELKIYLTDAEAQNPAPIPQETIDAVVLLPGSAKALPVEFKAVKDAAAGQTAGDDTSIFSVHSEALKGAQRFSIAIASIFVQGCEVNDIRFTYPAGDH